MDEVKITTLLSYVQSFDSLNSIQYMHELCLVTDTVLVESKFKNKCIALQLIPIRRLF